MVNNKKNDKTNISPPNLVPPNHMMPPHPTPEPTSSNIFINLFRFIQEHLSYLNNSKFFAGIIMILMNIGSRYVTINLSKSAEEYLKYSLSKQILIFAMCWMGTRDIIVALALTAIFTILSDHLLNEESSFCIVPSKYRILHTLVDTNKDGKVSDAELKSAVAILEKSKKEKQQENQKKAFTKFKEWTDKDELQMNSLPLH